MPEPVRVAITVPLQPELVARIDAVDPRIEVVYEAELLPPVRYPDDTAAWTATAARPTTSDGGGR